jgi:MFS family permease
VTVTEQRAVAARPVTGALTVLCLIQFMDVLGVTVVVTALPDMLAGVHAGPDGGTLVATGYAMLFGGLLMLGARLGDRIGHRRTILVATALFALGSALGALAPGLAVLTAARCIQGAAAAAAVPSALRLLTTLAPDERTRGRALAGWSAAGAAAGASGFVVGGVVTDLAGWRVIFVGLVPTAVVLALAVGRTIPADPPGGARTPLNLAGSALLTGAVMAAVGGATALGKPGWRGLGAGLVAGAAALAVAFVLLDRRATAPLLPGRVLRHRPLRRGATGSFLNTATTSSVGTLVTLYLQNTLGRSPLAAAATLVPISVAAVIGSSLAAPVLLRVALEHVVAIGLLVIAAGDAGLLLAAPSGPALAGCSAAIGLGLGLSSVAANSLGTDVPEQHRATASGAINTAAQLGTALGVAAVLLVAAASTGVPSAHTRPPDPAWGVAAALALAGAVWFAVGRRRAGSGPRGRENGLAGPPPG